MKYLLIPLILVLHAFVQAQPGQASDSQKFKLTVLFQEGMDLSKLEVTYLERSGHYFSPIFYTIDENKNSIVLEGVNHYIVGVSIPSFIFFFKDLVIMNMYTERMAIKNYYLISDGHLDAYLPENEVTTVVLKDKAVTLMSATETEGSIRVHHSDLSYCDDQHAVRRTLFEHALMIVVPDSTKVK